MAIADAVRSAPKVTLTNLNSGETLEAQFNPTELEEQVQANFAAQQVPGLSHEVLQFSHTGNHGFPLALFFRAMSPEEMAAMHRARRFLLSLAYPMGEAQDVAGGGSPRVLVVWPRMLSMTCIVRRVAIRHTLFNAQGRSRVYTATVQFEEIRDFRISSEEVFEDNQFRFGEVPGLDIEDEAQS